MAKRLSSIIRVDTAAVQGEGSYARIRRMNVEEMRKCRQTANDKEQPFNAFEAGVQLLRDHVIDWDWVGDDGKPLPFPDSNPEVIEVLTDDEVAILGAAIQGSVEKIKN